MSPPYLGLYPDGSCAGCGQRMIRITPEQTAHPCCEPTEGAAGDSAKALLTLAASGLAVEIVTGGAQDAAALWVGRLWGRRQGTAVVIRDGLEVGYAWPAQWERLLTDCAGHGDDRLHVRAELQDGGAPTGPVVRWLG